MVAAVLSTLISLISLLVRGLVLVDLWAWFVVPLGAPAIGALHALGISLLIQFVVVDVGAARSGAVTAIANVVLACAVWVMGWAIHMVML